MQIIYLLTRVLFLGMTERQRLNMNARFCQQLEFYLKLYFIYYEYKTVLKKNNQNNR